MRKTTTEEKLKNILIARAMLDDLPNNAIVDGLCDWNTGVAVGESPNHCGAAACFGGWVALHPYFREQYGIRSARGDGMANYGQPRTRHEIDTDKISMELFGVSDAFYSNETRWSSTRLSDRQLIKKRLRTAFNKLNAL